MKAIVAVVLSLAICPLLLPAQNAGDIKKIRIDPDAAAGGTVSQFIDSILYIPLERTKESQIVMIAQLEVTDDHFIILDKGTNALLIFTKTGKFQAKIPVDRTVCQFHLNKKAGQIEVIKGAETFFYTVDGKLENKINSGNRPNTLLGVISQPLDEHHTAYYNTSWKTTPDSLIHQLVMYENGKPSHSFLPYPALYKLEVYDHIGPINFSTNLNEGDTGIYYFTNYDYTVYRLTPSSIRPVYQFMFPLQRSLPNNFTNDTAWNGKRMAFIRKRGPNEVIPRLYRFYRKDDMLFFSEGKYSYAFNTSKQYITCLSKITSDASSYYLPVTDTEVNTTQKSVLLQFDGNRFYFSCAPETLYSQMEATKSKKPVYPSALASYFSNSKNRTDGNPVLVQVKFKNNF